MPDYMGDLTDIPWNAVLPLVPAREPDTLSRDGEQSQHDAMLLDEMLDLQDQCDEDLCNEHSLLRVRMKQDEVDEDEWGLALAYHCSLALMNWDLEQEQRAERLASYIKDVEVEQLAELSEIAFTAVVAAQCVRLGLDHAPPTPVTSTDAPFATKPLVTAGVRVGRGE